MQTTRITARARGLWQRNNTGRQADDNFSLPQNYTDRCRMTEYKQHERALYRSRDSSAGGVVYKGWSTDYSPMYNSSKMPGVQGSSFTPNIHIVSGTH
jgi:hypothetical protein